MRQGRCLKFKYRIMKGLSSKSIFIKNFVILLYKIVLLPFLSTGPGLSKSANTINAKGIIKTIIWSKHPISKMSENPNLITSVKFYIVLNTFAQYKTAVLGIQPHCFSGIKFSKLKRSHEYLTRI